MSEEVSSKLMSKCYKCKVYAQRTEFKNENDDITHVIIRCPKCRVFIERKTVEQTIIAWNIWQRDKQKVY